MRRLSCTGTLLAMTIASYSGAAFGQQSCDAEIQQLRTQNQERQVDERQRQQTEQMLDRAERADARNCEVLVLQVRQEMEQTEAQEATQPQTQSQSQRQSTTQPTQARAQSLEQQRQPDDTTDVQIQQAPAEVEVDAGAPQVTVKQQPPKVTVEQQPPQVEITQPEADVNVRQAEPQVTVNQAEPNVQVQQAEPEVRVTQAGEPEVRMVGPESEAEVRTNQPQQQDASGATGQLQSSEQQRSAGSASDERDAARLVGQSAVSRDGEEVGEISAVVQSQSGDELYAVVDVGGFLGIGERTVAIPLERGEIDQDGNLRVSMTREQLEEMREYDPQHYSQYDLVQ